MYTTYFVYICTVEYEISILYQIQQSSVFLVCLVQLKLRTLLAFVFLLLFLLLRQRCELFDFVAVVVTVNAIKTMLILNKELVTKSTQTEMYDLCSAIYYKFERKCTRLYED